MKVLIFGPGWLGKKFNEYFEGSILSTVDITDYRAVVEELNKHKPDAVLNTAGKTGKPNIDWCEDHKLETLVSNVTGPQVLLRATQELGIRFAHLSSGCIYEGDNGGRGWTEEDKPNFYGSFYSRTKIYAEGVLKEFPVLILRLRMPFDNAPSERNLINKLLKYDKVISVPNSITIIPDLLSATKALVEKQAAGIYNVTNPGSITHPEILEMYKEIVDPSHQYSVISLDELGKLTKTGRSNCVLSSEKLAREGIAMRPVKEAVRKCLEEYKTTYDKH